MNAVVSHQDELTSAVQDLDAEVGKGGLDSSRRRESALLQGLRALAGMCGRELRDLYGIDSLGELPFNIKHPTKDSRESCGNFGMVLGADLGRVPTRCGNQAVQVAYLPENGWTRLNHFDAERLIRLVHEDLAVGRRGAMERVALAVDAIGGTLGTGWERVPEDPGAVSSTVRINQPILDANGHVWQITVPVRVSPSTIHAGGTSIAADAGPDEITEVVRDSLVAEGWIQKDPRIEAARLLPRETVQALLQQHGESVSPESIHYYASVEALAERCTDSRHWAQGETFVYVESADKHVIACQVAPESCEMMVVCSGRLVDVYSAYRMGKDRFSDVLTEALAAQPSVHGPTVR